MKRDKKILKAIGILVITVVLISGCIKPAVDEKPEIIEFIVAPESPTIKETISIYIKATDDKGLQSIGFEVKETPMKEEFDCNSKKICEHTWQLSALPREGTFIVTVFAVDTSNQRKGKEKTVLIKPSLECKGFKCEKNDKCYSNYPKYCYECLRESKEKCACYDNNGKQKTDGEPCLLLKGVCCSGICQLGKSSCEEKLGCSSDSDCPSRYCSDKALVSYSCENKVCVPLLKDVECCQNADCNDQKSSTKDDCVNYKCKYTNITVTECISGDGICPPGCAYEQDTDCEPEATGGIMWVREVLNAVGRGVAIDSQNNVIISGGNTEKEPKGLIIKYSPDGDVIWEKVINWQETFKVRLGVLWFGLAVDSKDNIITSGCTGGPKDNDRSKDFVVVKYDKAGGKLWERRYDGGASEFIWRLAVDLDDNIIVTGGSGDGIYSSIENAWLTVKYSPDGDMLWEKRYTGHKGMGGGVAVDSYNNVIVSGSIEDNGMDVYTIKYNPNGEVMWTKQRDFGGQDGVGGGVGIDSKNNIIVTGMVSNSEGRDIWAVKYDSEGNEIWNTVYDSGEQDWTQGMAIDKWDNIIVSGAVIGENIYDYLTIKFNPEGELIWEDIYDWKGGSDETHEVDVDSSGNIVTSGFCKEGERGPPTMVTIKYSQ